MAQGRLYQLDALRGIAAVMVVAYHLIYRYDELYGHAFDPASFLAHFKTGVYLFFMISGFVILWTVERSKRPMDFVFSRFSRLFPAYWFAVLLTFAVIKLAGPADRAVSFEALAANFTMIQQYLHYPHVDGVYWTLTVELTFYVMALAVMLCGLLRLVDWICAAWVAFSITINGLDLDIDILHSLLIVDYAPFFVIGIAFYRLWSGQSLRLPLANIALALVAVFAGFPGSVLAMTAIYVAVMGLVASGKLQWLGHPALIWFGAVSYCFYLVHQNIGYSVINYGYSLGLPAWANIAMAFGVTLAAAYGIHKAIEQPVLRILRAWYRGRKDARALALS